MKWIANIWLWLDGKKSAIVALAWTVLNYVQAHNLITPETFNALATILTGLTALAVGHKIVKAAEPTK